MTELPYGRPPGGRFGLGKLLLAITLSAAWYLALRPAVDPDYGWHVENGRRVLDGSAFAGRDPYSWTATGEWIVHEWLVEAGMSAIHDWIGPAGNSILAALLWTFAFLLVAWRLRARGFGWPPVVLTVALGFLCTMMSAGVRPQVLELVFLAASLIVVDMRRKETMSIIRFVGSMAVLMVLWVNTHGSFPLLIAVLGASAAGALLERHPAWRSYGLAVIVTALAAMSNPWGWDIYGFATQSMMSQPTLQSIEEWKAPKLLTGSLLPFDIAAILAMAAALVTTGRLSRKKDGKTLSEPNAGDVLVFLGMLYLALSSGRHVMLFGIGAAPLIAWAIDMSGHRLRRRQLDSGGNGRVGDQRVKDAIHIAAATVVVVAIAVAGWRAVSPAAQSRAIASRYPAGIVDELRTLVRSPGRMFNEYSWGGFLIANDVTPVFIDGRSELYGDAQLIRYGRIVRMSPGWSDTVDSLGVNVAVLRRDSPLAAALGGSGWRIAASDSVGVALVRLRLVSPQ